MTKGKRPTHPTGTPWLRWAGVAVGLAIVAGGILWWVSTRDTEEVVSEEPAPEAAGPQPLDLAGGPTIAEASIADVPPESLVAPGPEAPSGVVVSNDPRLGDPDAPVVIVEFSDFQCPHCADFHTNTFPALRSLYGDRIRWYFVNRFFSGPHPHAEAAAIAGECANRQGKFWEFADRVFRRQSELDPELLDGIATELGLDKAAFDQCRADPSVAAEVAADQQEAERLKVDGTPTFIVNGQRVLGAQPVGVFNEVIGPYFQ